MKCKHGAEGYVLLLDIVINLIIIWNVNQRLISVVAIIVGVINLIIIWNVNYDLL